MRVTAFNRDQLLVRLRQMQRPLQFAARQTPGKLVVLQGLEARLLEWLNAAYALRPPAEIVASLDACRRLFTGLDAADPAAKRRAMLAGLTHLTHLITLVNELSLPTDTDPTETSVTTEVRSMAISNLPAGDPINVLKQPIQFVRGVGPTRAQLLRRLGIETIQDALVLLPRRYEDRANLKPIRHLEAGKRETFAGTILVSGSNRTGRGRRLYEVIIGDATGTIRCLWFQFQEKYMRQRYRPGQHVIVTAEIRQSPYQISRREVHHPDIETVDDNEWEPLHVGRIVPIYPSTEGMPQKALRAVLKRVVDEYGRCYPEYLPVEIRERLRLMPVAHALQEVHFPPPEAGIEMLNRWGSQAHRRLIFEEFFLLELSLALRQRETAMEEPGFACHGTGVMVERLRTNLPFPLTTAQTRVLEEIFADMRRPHPMNRLLQGDVGSGKTIVALFAMVFAIESGYQTAIMAPTEILAEQHYLTIRTLVEPLGVRVALLTSATKGGAKRRHIQEAIGAGAVDLIIGTHALIQDAVAFKALGLAVIDEQHRFGVLQRATLKKKGYNPDVLVMTATPIPRTLAMTVYGDLEVSLIDELPPGRLPVVTHVCYDSRRGEVYTLMRRALQAGHQIYVVYPLIEESEKVDLRAAADMATQLRRDVFPEYHVGLLHGRMRSDEKEEIMRAFAGGQLQVLVSTTVIEVGVDVPNATVMVVEHAERFGLAQLHQLRGRVGRSAEQSYCVLMANFPMSEEAKQRLKALTECSDGFLIAERDLEIRGPGEFLGTRQSGLPELRVAHLIRDQNILLEARREAFCLVAQDPHLTEPTHVGLRQALAHRWQQKFELIHVG